MPQRHSPAVRYPLRHSEVLRWLWWVAVIAGAAAVLAWSWQGAGLGAERIARVAAAVLLWGSCAALGGWALRSQPQGVLYWDGQAWTWLCSGQAYVLQTVPTVVLDVQSLMVLRAVVQGRGVQHWVLQRAWAPHLWLDMRRAVYSLVHPTGAAHSEVP